MKLLEKLLLAEIRLVKRRNPSWDIGSYAAISTLFTLAAYLGGGGFYAFFSGLLLFWQHYILVTIFRKDSPLSAKLE